MSHTEARTVHSPTSTEGAPRIAVIGCSAVAELLYLPALAKYPSILKNLILVDRNRMRAQELAAKFKAKRDLVDYRDALSEGLMALLSPLQATCTIRYPWTASPVVCMCCARSP